MRSITVNHFTLKNRDVNTITLAWNVTGSQKKKLFVFNKGINFESKVTLFIEQDNKLNIYSTPKNMSDEQIMSVVNNTEIPVFKCTKTTVGAHMGSELLGTHGSIIFSFDRLLFGYKCTQTTFGHPYKLNVKTLRGFGENIVLLRSLFDCSELEFELKKTINTYNKLLGKEHR